jgi:hypothetical protein
MNPGPIAEVAIKKTAPMRVLRVPALIRVVVVLVVLVVSGVVMLTPALGARESRL